MRTIWGIDCNGVAYLTFVFRKGVLFLRVQRILRLNGVGFLAQMYLAVATGLSVIDRAINLKVPVNVRLVSLLNVNVTVGDFFESAKVPIIVPVESVMFPDKSPLG